MMFGAFERMVAFRYLRAKRQEGFISVIAMFSLLGIMLGVGTLIVVMSIMNGFRAELFSRVLGLNGHITPSLHRMAGHSVVMRMCWLILRTLKVLSKSTRWLKGKRW
jgi:ABC-type lipoprotein release transport system permease subunit